MKRKPSLSSLKRKKLPSLAKLKRRLDILFSQWIRRRDCAPNGDTGYCISCGTWAVLQAGHFIKRQHLALRFDERNVNGQCVRCNHFLHGNDAEYCLALIKRYGHSVVGELMRLKRTTVHMTREDYNTLIERYS